VPRRLVAGAAGQVEKRAGGQRVSGTEEQPTPRRATGWVAGDPARRRCGRHRRGGDGLRAPAKPGARYRVDGEGLIAAGLSLPDDVEHHFTTVSDGGRIHAVERGRGPTVVLVHGITWVWRSGPPAPSPGARPPGDRHRPARPRQSLAGTQGYSLERMAEDLAELLESLEVRDATVVGHSLGGMVAQLLALHHSDVIARRVSSWCWWRRRRPVLPACRARSGPRDRARHQEPFHLGREGKGIYLQEDLATWLTRLSLEPSPNRPTSS